MIYPPGLYYILDADNRPVACDLMTWAKWFEQNLNSRIVGYTEINSRVLVSTVFLGLDHRHFGKGPPLLFETMVFRDHSGEEMQRYVSWDDAEAGHAAMVKRLRAGAVVK